MDIRAFQDTISEITGIETARVITEGGEPTEIHVLAHPGKPAKQLVRDIQTVAQAQFHTAIDRRIISVVQIEGADAIAGNRPVVKDVNESVDSSRITVSVELTWHDERMVGSATGPAAQSTKLRLVAEATLAALEQALDEDVAFGVSAADIKTVGSHPVAVAVIVLVLGGNERVLTGSAIGDGDPSRSMVRGARRPQPPRSVTPTLGMITTARGQVSGFRFAVASPHNLTSTVAAQVLDGGGNAVDAAIAANAVQGTVAPETCGIGGDLFALVWEPGASSPAALNASGWAGSGVSASDLRDQGFESIPNDHPASVSIPGAVAGWFELARRFGSREISDLLAPAMAYAADGFPASNEFSRATAARFEQLAHQPSAQSFYPESTPAEVGTRIQRPLLYNTFAKICSEGREGFYRGSVARDVSNATGGLISVEDLASFAPDWVEPLRKSVLGHTGWTIGPNSQGYLTLAALRIFEMTGGAFDPDDPASHHRLIESYRAIAAERDDVVSDPTTAPLPAAALLADDRLKTIADSIGNHAGTFSPPPRRPGGTAYLTVVDGSGLAISLIQSNFHGIGSNIAAGSSGFILHNRGSGATLEPGHPNELMPGRRPLHTLSPTIWSKDGQVAAVLGTRGGHQQPQLLAQVAAHLFGSGDEPWSAQSRPRWTIQDLSASSPSTVRVEAGFGDDIIEGLRERGHPLELITGPTGGWGPVSLIVIGQDGLFTAAADPRVGTAQALAR